MNKLPFIFGISTTTLTTEEVSFFKDNIPVGIILFSRNIESKAQLLELTQSIKNILPDTLLFVDQEGGRVARIKPPVIDRLYPAAKYFSELYDEDSLSAKREVKANYIDMMEKLSEFNINSPCAPVCDLLYDDAHEIIGDRSFGNNLEKVIELCSFAITAIQHNESIAFLKHIPGHGRARLDSHYDLPIIDTDLATLEQMDFYIFKKLTERHPEDSLWGMTAHIIYSCIDPELPATISPKVIKYIREKIGFKNTLITDDICMYALHGEVGQKISLLKRVIKAVNDNQDWKTEYGELLLSLVKIDVSKIGNILILEECEKKLMDLKQEFLASLQKVTKMSIEAGCDIILHCSGELDEMKSVSSVSI